MDSYDFTRSLHNDCKSDEAIAQVLQQEEYGKVAAAESTGSSDDGAKKLQTSVPVQNWSTPAKTDNTYEGSSRVPKIADDYLHVEVGKRLKHVARTSHKPRTNSHIPSEDEAESNRKRLQIRLKLYNLVERKVDGDGNCQFRALSDQIYRSVEHHKFVRQEIVKQLKSHKELYKDHVPMSYDDYLEKMNKCGEWGDHVTLQAVADKYGFKIFMLTSFKKTCYIEILPRKQKCDRVIFLSFWAEVHYNSIYPPEEE